MSGFWYVRNALLTGNPFYPLHVAVRDRVILAGWYPSSVMRLSQYYLAFSDWRSLVDILLYTLDPRLMPFWVAALLVAGRLASRGRTQLLGLGRLGPAVLNVVLYWVLIPYRTSNASCSRPGVVGRSLGPSLSAHKALRVAGLVLLAAH